MSRNYPHWHRLKCAIGTVRYPKYKVYDLIGSTSFALSTLSRYSLEDDQGNVVAAAAAATINNSDTDKWGNTIKTLRAKVDATLLSEGMYALILKVVITTGMTEYFSWPIEVKRIGIKGRDRF